VKNFYCNLILVIYSNVLPSCTDQIFFSFFQDNKWHFYIRTSRDPPYCGLLVAVHLKLLKCILHDDFLINQVYDVN
jgi:hypothetical protein